MKYFLWLLLLAPFAAHATCTPEPCVTVSWSAPTQNSDGTAFASGTTLTYNLYAAPQGQPLIQVATGLTPVSTVRTNVVFGTTYCYAITAVAHVGTAVSAESVQTAPACGTPLQPIPATPAAPGSILVAGVTVTSVVYDNVKDPDHMVMLPVGSVAVGTACIGTEALLAQGVTYYAVPRASVKFSASVQPPIVYAVCG